MGSLKFGNGRIHTWIFRMKEDHSTLNHVSELDEIIIKRLSSVTRLGDLLNFGQVFEAFGSNQFAQISHILRHFL